MLRRISGCIERFWRDERHFECVWRTWAGYNSLMGLRNFFWRRVGAYPVRVRGERFVVNPDMGFRRWRRMGREQYEPETLDLLDTHLSPDSVMWDIGAHVGQMALYASRKCRHVVCFEPDIVALPSLYWNITRNRARNVSVVSAAMAASTGFIKMGAFSSDQGSLGRAVTSSLPSPNAKTIIVPSIGPEIWGGGWWKADPPDLIKMDIEGGEFELLPAMAEWLSQYRPKLYISLHAAALRSAGRMNTDEARQALETCVGVLSFYGEFTDLTSAKRLPLSELPALKLGEDQEYNPELLDGIFLE